MFFISLNPIVDRNFFKKTFSFSKPPETLFFESILFLILSSFFIRVLPALLFFGSSEIIRTLNRLEAPLPPLKPFIQIICFFHQHTGLPLVFWLKFPGILADTTIPAMIYFLVYQTSQDSRRAFFSGALYAFNPVSIITTSFAGSDVSVGLALLLASFIFCFVSMAPPLSALFFGTAVAAQNFFIVFLPVFMLKSGRKRISGPLFFFFSTLSFGCWFLPIFLQDGIHGYLLSSLSFWEWRDPLFGFTLLHEALQRFAFPFSLPIFFAPSSPFFHDLGNFYKDHFFLVFLIGITIIFYFHRKQNPFVLSTNIILYIFIIWPGINPFHLVWSIPFLIFTLNKSVKYFSTVISLFLISWHCFVFKDSSAFSALKPLNTAFSNMTLYQEKWIHGFIVLTGDLLIPCLLLLSFTVSFFAHENSMDNIKTKEIGGRFRLAITCAFGLWLFAGSNPAFSFSWNRPPMSSPDINRTVNHATPYGEGFYFRHVIDMDTEITQAGIKVVSDNPFMVYVNGEMIFSDLGGHYRASLEGKASSPIETHPIDLTPYLKKGKNVLAMESLHLTLRPACGLAVWWEIQGKGKENFSLPFFEGWKAVDQTPPPDWTSLHFTDSQWPPPIISRGNPSKTMEKLDGARRTMESFPPNRPEKLFYMFPKHYTPPYAPFTIVHLGMVCTLIFFFSFYFLEGWLRAPYIFFQGTPNR